MRRNFCTRRVEAAMEPSVVVGGAGAVENTPAPHPPERKLKLPESCRLPMTAPHEDPSDGGVNRLACSWIAL